MSLIAAAICAVGVGSALFMEADSISLQALSIRPDTLGNYLTSSFAIVFNLSLLAAGFCVMLAMISVFFAFQDLLSRYLAMTGFIMGVSILLMGIFPIHFLDMHRKISTVYLLASSLLHVLSLISHTRAQNNLSIAVLILSILGVTCTAILMLQLDWSILDFPPCDHADNSPCFVALNMWALTQINIAWCVLLSLGVRKLIKAQQYSVMHSQYANL
ncbi:hypothetical protein [Shewanella maritima]|uniref:hypothetical protein n=1 Tax=Shewanella maritima TaxID=2520507 RepID=UPI0037364BD9